MEVNLPFSSFTLEIALVIAISLASILIGAEARKSSKALKVGMVLAILGVVIVLAIGAPVFDAHQYPPEIAEHKWEILITDGATDPVGVIMLQKLIMFILAALAITAAAYAAVESVGNDVLTVLLMSVVLLHSLLAGIVGLLIAVGVAMVASRVARKFVDPYVQTIVLIAFGVATVLANHGLKALEVHLEIAFLAAVFIGGLLINRPNELENEFEHGVHEAIEAAHKTLDKIEFAALIIVSIMFLMNTFVIAELAPHYADEGGQFMAEMRLTRVAYAVGGLPGIITGAAGTPAIAVASLTATKMVEEGHIEAAAFIAGGVKWSDTIGLLICIVIILLANARLKMKERLTSASS